MANILNNIFKKIVLYFKSHCRVCRLRSDKHMKISTVVLCYNGEEYLNSRLQSIINQTFKPYEIIFLDDASTDNSVKLAKSILKKSKIRHKTIVNKHNTGCGNQIIKGLHESKGDFIWFAEQDDYCSTEMLNSVKEILKDTSVNLAFCKSIPVDCQNKKLENYYCDEENLVENYCVDGVFEVESKLCIKNTVYNISSVVFRKSSLKGVERFIGQYKVFFDWIIYSYVLRNGKIHYCANVLNYHMRHSGSIIARYLRHYYFYEDLFSVKKYILENYNIQKENVNNMLLEIERNYHQHGCEGHNSPDISGHPMLAAKYQEFKKTLESYMDKRCID